MLFLNTKKKKSMCFVNIMYKYIIQIFFKKTTTYKFKNPVLLSLKEVNKTNPFPASLLPVTFVTYL